MTSLRRARFKQDKVRNTPSSDLSVEHRGRLMIWLSPAFPIGAYAYSQGLESAVSQKLVTNGVELKAWLQDFFTHGPVRNDLILLGETLRACRDSDTALLHETSMLGSALSTSSERHRETHNLGESFLSAIEAGWPEMMPGKLPSDVRRPLVLPVSFGLVASNLQLDANEIVLAFALATLSNLLSAAIRLGVIGQRQSLQIHSDLEDLISKQSRSLGGAKLENLGTACWMTDFCSMAHETQRTRLFLS